MSDKLNTILNRVQMLLNLAEHPNTPPHEAASARAKAEAMMLKYRIEEEEVRQTKLATGAGDAITPMVHDIIVCASSSEFKMDYLQLLGSITEHVGNIKWAYRSVLGGDVIAQMVGFESDVRYAETLYTALRLHFSNKLEPKVDPDLSDEDNVYNLRSAGIERPVIGQMMGWGRDAAQKVTIVYKRACAARGEDPKVVGKSLNVKTYRRSFADAYVSRIWSRLRDMRDAQYDAGGSGALVLRGRKEAVDEMFYRLNPHLRPSTQPATRPSYGPYGTCPRCHKAKGGYCREHAYLKPRSVQKKVSYVGLRAGSEAANTADLGTKASSNRVTSEDDHDAIEM